MDKNEMVSFEFEFIFKFKFEFKFEFKLFEFEFENLFWGDNNQIGSGFDQPKWGG